MLDHFLETKSSLLDHIYVTNPATLLDISNYIPPFGDHVLVIAKLVFKIQAKERNCTLKRNWINYRESGLNNNLIPCIDTLMSTDNLLDLNVQELWNCLENAFIEVIDKHAPLCNHVKKKVKPYMSNAFIKNKLNKRKRLLKFNKDHNTLSKYPEIKTLNKEISAHFRSLRIGNVKRTALGVNGNIWKAVKVAKDLNSESFPTNFFKGGEPVAADGIASSFAAHFNEKVTLNVRKTKVCPNVYNGKCKMLVQNRNFMQIKM